MSPKQSRMSILKYSFAAASLFSEVYKALKDTDLLFISPDAVMELLDCICVPCHLIPCKDVRYLWARNPAQQRSRNRISAAVHRGWEGLCRAGRPQLSSSAFCRADPSVPLHLPPGSPSAAAASFPDLTGSTGFYCRPRSTLLTRICGCCQDNNIILTLSLQREEVLHS